MRLIFLFCLLLVMTACGGDTEPTATTNNNPTAAPSTDNGAQTNNPTAAPASSEKLLVWIGEGPSPDAREANSTGQVAYMLGDGTLETLLELPGEVIGVSACGTDATSPDGRYFTFFVNSPQAGADGGTLYQIDSAGSPVVLGETQALTCLGNRTFQYAADSSRLAYIAYPVLQTNAEFATGTLQIVNPADAAVVSSIEDVAGFYLATGAAYAVQFFPNAEGEVDEAAVRVWNGTESSELAALYPAENCRFSSAQPAPTSDNRLAIIFGQRCSGSGNTTWQLYFVNLADGSSSMALSDTLSTGFFPYTRTNNVIPAAGGGTLLFTVTDGLTASSVGVRRVDISTLTPETVINRGALMPRYDARRFSFPDNASAIMSRDGRWWATVVAEGSTPSVNVIDLSNPTAAPISVTAPSRTDNIPVMAFSPDSSTLYYLAGGRNGNNNTLFRLDLASGNSALLSRGQFGAGVVSPNGQTVSMTSWMRAADQRNTPYTDLVSISTADGSATPIFTGVELNADGTVANRRFAHPLTWRR